MGKLRYQASLIAIAVAAALSGCASLKPEPFTPEEVKQRVVADRQAMFADQEPINAPITFSEAAARALKYNLDYRLKLMENALAQGLYDVSRWDMMPRLLVGAGYVTRNNDSGGRSIGILTGLETLSPSTSQERTRTLANVELSWNLLDFGVSYYRAQQKADQYLMAQERQRKVIQNVLQDTRNAYWRALGAQKLISRVDDLLWRVNRALERSRQAEQQGLLPQPTALAYQRALLDATTLLSLRRQELELAKAELAALMSIPPGTQFTLAEEKEPPLPAVPRNMDELETLALERRPEIMEEWYRKRVTANDIKAAMLQTLPGVQLDFANAQYDSNRFLYNSTWVDSGIRISWNLFRLASRPALERAHKAQEATDDYRRMALAMAVLTQVRVGVQRYALARNDLDMAEESARVDARLYSYARAAVTTRVDSELEMVRAEARQLLSEYQRYASYSNAQSAWGRLYNSIGLDVLPEEIAAHDVATLARSIDTTLKSWESMTFGQAAAPRADVPPATVTLGADFAGVDAGALERMAQKAFARQEIYRDRSNRGSDAQRFDIHLAASGPARSARTIEVNLVLHGAGEPKRFAYATVAGEMTARAAIAALDAAIDFHARAIRTALGTASSASQPAKPAAGGTPQAGKHNP